MQHLESAGLPPAHAPVARGIRAAAAVMITLVAPVISMSGALTTGLNGTSPAVKFPPGYGVALAATEAATTIGLGGGDHRASRSCEAAGPPQRRIRARSSLSPGLRAA
jgi:hypothetical protein